jgi:hypothetical protein
VRAREAKLGEPGDLLRVTTVPFEDGAEKIE